MQILYRREMQMRLTILVDFQSADDFFSFEIVQKGLPCPAARYYKLLSSSFHALHTLQAENALLMLFNWALQLKSLEIVNVHGSFGPSRE